MSMPPLVKWRYDWQPEPGTPEARLYSDFLRAARLGWPGRHVAPRRIGLFGGSFDPVHNAHLALARQALAELQLDEAALGSGRPRLAEDAAADAAPRSARRCCAWPSRGEPRFVLDRCELRARRARATRSTPCASCRRASPAAQWFLRASGRTSTRSLHTWHGWRELLPRVTLAVAQPAGQPRRTAARRDVRAAPTRGAAAADGHLVHRHPRARGRRRTSPHLVPPAVARYIDQHGLYRGTARS